MTFKGQCRYVYVCVSEWLITEKRMISIFSVLAQVCVYTAQVQKDTHERLVCVCACVFVPLCVCVCSSLHRMSRGQLETAELQMHTAFELVQQLLQQSERQREREREREREERQ